MTSQPVFSCISKRGAFVHASKSPHKIASRTVVLQYVPADQRQKPSDSPIRLGLTATRKLGNAVKRNRIRRKMREAFRAGIINMPPPAGDYVLVGRYNTYETPFATIARDIAYCLRKLPRADQ